MKKLFAAIILPMVLLSLSHLAAGQTGSGSLDQQLMQAAANGDVAQVQQLLDKGANIEAKDNGFTVLIVAASQGRADVVKLLLDKGANIEAKDQEGDTALYRAAYLGNADTVKLLLDKGANIEAKENFGHTALIIAAERGHADVARLLIEKGANIEAKDIDGDTALIEAAEFGHADVVKQLLGRGANPDAVDKWGWRAIGRAQQARRSDVVELLTLKDTDVENELFASDVELVKFALEKGANIEAKANNGWTPLMHAAYNGRVDVVKLLLDKGANIEAKASNGDTALFLAAAEGHADVAKLLLDKGADIEAKNKDGDTALLVASEGVSADTVKLLLERGANIEAKNSLGNTPLEVAELWNRAHLGNRADLVQILQSAVAANPLTAFDEMVSALSKTAILDSERERVIKAAVGLQRLPAIPVEARQAFLQATTLLQNIRTAQTSSPGDLQQPLELLFTATTLAPWWGDAYYNYSRALELSGQYDDAVKQLNYYLELKPSDADAADARSKIAVIQAEKQSAANKKQEKDAVQATNYVSGGVTRLRPEDTPAWWRPNQRGGIVTLYLYGLDDDPYYLNAFRMPNNRIISIFLVAQSNNGAYVGDTIAIEDLTQESCHGRGVEGRFDFTFGSQSYTEPCGFHYDVSVTNLPNAVITVKYSGTATITLPVALLYRARPLKARGAFGGCGDGTMYQGGESAMKLKFDCSVVQAAQDPNANAMGLTPISVTPYQPNKQ